MDKRHLVILTGLGVNIVVYSIVTTFLLTLAGGGILFFLFIPFRVYHCLAGHAYLAQMAGIVVGLCVSVIPVKLYVRRFDTHE